MENFREQYFRYFMGEKRLVLGKRLDRLDEQGVGFGFEDEAFRAGLENLPDHVIGLIRGEDEDLGAWQPPLDLLRRIEAVELRHAHVHHHNVGFEEKRLLDRLTAGRGDATNFPARLSFDDRARAFAHDVVIVGNKNSDSCVLSLS